MGFEFGFLVKVCKFFELKIIKGNAKVNCCLKNMFKVEFLSRKSAKMEFLSRKSAKNEVFITKICQIKSLRGNQKKKIQTNIPETNSKPNFQSINNSKQMLASKIYLKNRFPPFQKPILTQTCQKLTFTLYKPIRFRFKFNGKTSVGTKSEHQT
jgi:hypothetical protein